MCQGIIVSLVKFQNKSGQQEQTLLSGIGSHSTMFQENREFLISRGWIESSGNESIISIESDFTKGWNHSTIESGKPNETDLELLKKEYKRIAGGPEELIEHVRKCKKIDDALVELLTPEASKQYEEAEAPILKQYKEAVATIRKQYNEAVAPFLKQYEEAKATIRKQYDEAVAPFLKQYEEAKAPILKQYDEAVAPFLKQYDEAEALILKQYDEAVAPILKQYKEAKAPILKQYDEAKAPILKQYDEAASLIWKQYEEALAQIWIELFQITNNRIDILK